MLRPRRQTHYQDMYHNARTINVYIHTLLESSSRSNKSWHVTVARVTAFAYYIVMSFVDLALIHILIMCYCGLMWPCMCNNHCCIDSCCDSAQSHQHNCVLNNQSINIVLTLTTTKRGVHLAIKTKCSDHALLSLNLNHSSNHLKCCLTGTTHGLCS